MSKPEVHLPGMHLEEEPYWEMDVVCGMELDPRTTSHHFHYKLKVYYFCNNSCLEHFKNNPEQYAS